MYEEARGMDDEEIIQKAFAESRILITNDKGFGEKVYRDRWPHKGVILLRLDDERTENKIEAVRRLLAGYADRLHGQFVVATETTVRFARQ